MPPPSNIRGGGSGSEHGWWAEEKPGNGGKDADALDLVKEKRRWGG